MLRHRSGANLLLSGSPAIAGGADLRKQFGIDPGRRDFFGNPLPVAGPLSIGAHERFAGFIGAIDPDIPCALRHRVPRPEVTNDEDEGVRVGAAGGLAVARHTGAAGSSRRRPGIDSTMCAI